MALVGVLVGHQHGVQSVDPGRQKLLAHVRRGIHKHQGWLGRARRPGPDQDRTARPAVPGLGRVTGAPVIADPRNAAGRAAPKDTDLQPAL